MQDNTSKTPVTDAYKAESSPGAGAPRHLLSFGPANAGPVKRRIFSLVRRPVEQVLALNKLNRIYAGIGHTGSAVEFLDQVLDGMNVACDVPPADMNMIPRTGPTVVVANHPFGGIEGMLLARLLLALRPDVKIMANYLLGLIPELRDMFIFVDPFGAKTSYRKNIAALRESVRFVKDGGMLVVFPAGTVSHLHLVKRKQAGNAFCRRVTDPAWSSTVGRIVRKTGAQVLPVFFHGGNGPLVHLMGLIHPRLRTAMLPRQLANKEGRAIRVKIGSPIQPRRLAGFDSDRDLVGYLRVRTYALGFHNDEATGWKRLIKPRLLKKPVTGRAAPVAGPGDPELIEREVSALDQNRLLAQSGEMAVYIARAEQVPNVLAEIGRLREITFRAVGEGTGRSRDLDEYDGYYRHLFLYNRETREIAGAYRIGRTDRIIKEIGLRGLYSSSLFKFDKKLFEIINPALELGRSFVRPEYQRRFSSLMLLWKGIGRYVSRNPRYRVLFGPVSISSDYNRFSRLIISTFLQDHLLEPDLARLVKAKRPLKDWAIKKYNLAVTSALLRDVEELSEFVADLEAGRRGVPVLLRQYLKLGGRIIGLNVDPDFSNVLDGLMLVDLSRTDPRFLAKFMGKPESEEFLSRHRVSV